MLQPTTEPTAPSGDADARPQLTAALADERLTVMGLLAEAFFALAARGNAQIGAYGLSQVEFEVLVRLARSPEGLLRMTDLTAQTSLTNSGITRVCDRLVDRGLVARQACATDRRTTYAVVTDAGRDLLEQVLPGHLDMIDRDLLAPLRAGGGHDLDVVVAALRRLRDHLAPCATAGSDGALRADPRLTRD